MTDRLRLPSLIALGLAAALGMQMSVSGQGPSSTDALPRATPESVGLRAEPLTASTSLLQRAVDERTIAGAVALVARNGWLAHAASVGFQDLDTRAPMADGRCSASTR